MESAAGPDGFSPRVLKPLSAMITKPPSITCRESIKTCKVPKDRKIQCITVMYKRRCKSLAENYRPVSLTSILSKIQEKLVRKHIMDHMILIDLFSKRQYRFLGGRTTVLQLIRDMCRKNILSKYKILKIIKQFWVQMIFHDKV